MKSPVALLSSILHDVKRLEPSVKGLDRDLHTIKVRFEHEGYGFLTVALPSICEALDRGLADGVFACPLGFCRTGALPRLFLGLLCNVFDTKTGQLLTSPSISCIKLIREICRLFKKLIYSQTREDKLHEEAVNEFLACDRAIPNGICHPGFDFYLEPIAKMILPSLSSFDTREIHAKHGPGSVAESYSPNQKWQGVLADMHLHADYVSTFGFDCIIHSTVDDPAYRSDKLIKVESISSDVPVGIAKLISVPKSSLARRTISMEPVLNQFVQQGLNTVLRDSISQCPILRECLALTSQHRNQISCVEGSRTGLTATVDLLSASDRLSLRFVEKIFTSKPEFLFGLKSSRSAYIEVEKRQYKLAKYAGMGNATTFPVQSVAFALLAICSIIDHDGDSPSYWNAKRASRLLRVFGDDITIPSKYVTSLDRWLTHYGLKINHKKSFSTGFFRESCGVDAYRGYDVTPIYVKSLPSLLQSNQDLIPHLVSISNKLWERCLYSGSELVRKWVEDLVGPLPLVSKYSGGLGWHSRVDANVAQKWDGKLQRFVFQTLVVSGLRKPDKLDGYAALFKCLVNLSNRTSDQYVSIDSKHLESSPQRYHSRLRRRWLPAQAGIYTAQAE